MRKTLVLVLTIVLVAGLSTIAWTDHCGSPKGKAEQCKAEGEMKSCAHMCLAQMELTDEQSKQIADICAEMEQPCKDTAAKMDAVKAELKDLIDADDVSPAEVKNKMRELAELKAKQKERQVDCAFKMKEVLTKEQWDKAKGKLLDGLMSGQMKPKVPGAGMETMHKKSYEKSQGDADPAACQQKQSKGECPSKN